MGTPNKGITKTPLHSVFDRISSNKGIFAIPLFGVPTLFYKVPNKVKFYKLFFVVQKKFNPKNIEYSAFDGCMGGKARNSCSECEFDGRRGRRDAYYTDYLDESSSSESETSSSGSESSSTGSESILSSNTDCDNDEDERLYIVGPSGVSQYGNVPWQVSLSTDGARCGGTLISMRVRLNPYALLT